MEIIKKTKNETTAWKVEDTEVMFHSVKNIFYCWSCGVHYCEHISQLRAHLTKRAADGASWWCKKCTQLNEAAGRWNCAACGTPRR